MAACVHRVSVFFVRTHSQTRRLPHNCAIHGPCITAQKCLMSGAHRLTVMSGLFYLFSLPAGQTHSPVGARQTPLPYTRHPEVGELAVQQHQAVLELIYASSDAWPLSVDPCFLKGLQLRVSCTQIIMQMQCTILHTSAVLISASWLQVYAC